MQHCGDPLIIKAFTYRKQCEKKRQGFLETLQGTRFPNGKPSSFLISETERTAPSLSVSCHTEINAVWKCSLCTIMPCSTASYWNVTESPPKNWKSPLFTHSCVISNMSGFMYFFHWKKLKNIHVTLSIPLHEHFSEFPYFPQKNNKIWFDTRFSENVAIVIWVNYPFNATWKNCRTSDNPVVLALFWAMVHSSSLYALQIVS